MKVKDLDWEVLEVDFSRTPPVVEEMRHKAVNGWTISVVRETKPALSNVAAWPTNDAEKDVRWFVYADGRIDARCYDHHEVEARIAEILKADHPSVVRSSILDDPRFGDCPEPGANTGMPWTEEEMWRLLTLFKAGGFELAVKHLGRSRFSCQSRFSSMKYDMGVPAKLRREALKVPNQRGRAASKRQA